ncbi:MAG: SufD family Fe-S cluster assembly protein, partial [Bdellovibrionales bacterium]|nr:SufD family Fe-S cluster assembly protein [Bdellovibrionales bacterium]
PEDIMRSINSAFANNYLVVKVVGVAHQTLKIKNLELKASPENTFVVPRILLHLDKEASLQCEVNLMSTEIHLMDGIVDVYLSSGGKLDLAMTLKSSNDSSLILSNRVKMCDNSQLNVGLLAQGSKLTRVDQQVFIEGECCQADIAIVYQAKEHQQVDIHSTVNHLCPRGKSFQNIKGILEDKSRAIVNGRIYIQQGAQEVDSHLLNNNLLLSDNAEVNTKPELEVEADNVKAAHGATVGQLDKEELFYCATRAIDEKLARNLILKGFLLDAFNQNPFFVKSELLSSIEVTLD